MEGIKGAQSAQGRKKYEGEHHMCKGRNKGLRE